MARSMVRLAGMPHSVFPTVVRAEGVLPASLTHLTFGYRFNQPLAEGVLPASLKQLTLGWEFDQPAVIPPRD